ncbi:MAG: acyl-CoA carboxylase subunit beta [Cellulosilyticaceae bacterium]
MSTLQKLSELEARRLDIANAQDDVALKAATSKGKLTARARIAQLFDENSFVEIGAFVSSRSTAFNMKGQDTPADGVVCGYGTVGGQLVYVYSQDQAVMGGAIGEMHAKKIIRMYQEAVKVGAPIVGFIDTAGLRLQEQLDGLEGFGQIFNAVVGASGVVPQIAVVCGECGGGASFIAGLSDFVFISKKNGQMFLNSPNTFEDKKATFDTVAKADVHLEQSGLATFGADTEEELIGDVRKLLGYLPNHCEEAAPCYDCVDDLNRGEAGLNAFDFETGEVTTILTAVVDDGQFLEVSKAYGENSFVGFARMNGSTVGVIANKQPVLGYADIKKITGFVKNCENFNLPIVSFTDVERFESTAVTEQLGIIKEASMMIKAFADANVPKINVILRRAYGSAYVTMNSSALGADYVYAWPTAQIATMNSESAVRIMYDKEIREAEVAADFIAEQVSVFEEETSSVYAAAARGYVDDIIEPAATRKRVIAALEVLFTKQAW